MALRTRVCDLLGIEYPIVLAGMGGASVPRLAAAVSNAGGLGVLGAAGCSPRRLRAWIEETRRLTNRPFGVDTLLPASVRRQTYKAASGPSPLDKLSEYQQFAREFMEHEGLAMPDREALMREAGIDPSDHDGPQVFSKEFFEAQMEVVVDEKVPVYAAGLGNPGPWLDRLHANGTKVIAVVGVVRHALQVAETGVDIIVAQGHDGGGHNSPIGTMALIPQVVDVVGDIPVLGAGGITDGRGVAAAMMLGAQGAWVGSAFLATDEAGILDFQKQALVEGGDESTTVSRCVTGKPARIIRSRWTQAWEASGLEALPMPFQPMVAMPVLAAAAVAKRKDIAPGIAGQGLGMIKAVRPAADVLRDLVAGAETALKSAAARA
jgi:nitronate monooxygenase